MVKMIAMIANIIAFDVYFLGITFRFFIQMLLLIFLLFSVKSVSERQLLT